MSRLGARRLMITGGEPLMRKDLFRLLRQASKLGIDVGLLTNGWLINQEKSRQLSDWTQSVGVSLDGASAETHDQIRGRGSFNKACQAITLLADHLPVSVYITVSAVNLSQLENTIKLAKRLGAVSVHVSEINLAGRAESYSGLLALKPGQLAKLNQLASKLAKQTTPGVTCTADLSSVYLSAEGLVYPCSEVGISASHLSLANITSQDGQAKLRQAVQRKTADLATPCCYQVYAGQGISFCLNRKHLCPLLLPERNKP